MSSSLQHFYYGLRVCCLRTGDLVTVNWNQVIGIYEKYIVFENIPPMVPSPLSNTDVQRAEGMGGIFILPPVSLPFLMAVPHHLLSFICQPKWLFVTLVETKTVLRQLCWEKNGKNPFWKFCTLCVRSSIVMNLIVRPASTIFLPIAEHVLSDINTFKW